MFGEADGQAGLDVALQGTVDVGALTLDPSPALRCGGMDRARVVQLAHGIEERFALCAVDTDDVAQG
ncbi:hypothetical protein GCM10007147_23070 [Nocardiopsis kunsanensis]|uniref:Uncharacterized protein n=1 Tax=Nocardiopsis kunsanensis TaxID=141693 RepID=A0A918XDB9_9ACTN|nr:hypothetical protein GCM10007147_23070 [Nocardiopsis kunsanensis]